MTVRLKLSQALAFAPAHLGESNRSGLAGITGAVHVTVGLDSETVPDAGLAAKLIIPTEIPREQNKKATKVRKLARPLSEPFLFFMLS